MCTARAYGDIDDHLRLAVLIASQYADVEQSLAQRCRKKKLTWRDRKATLEELLGIVASRPEDVRAPLCLIDPDALVPTIATRALAWEDRVFLHERQQLFQLLADSPVVVFLRTAPASTAVSARLAELGDPELDGVDDFVAFGTDKLAAAVRRLAPAVRPVLHWLLSSKLVSAPHAVRLLETASNPADDVLDEAYDTLRPTERATARKLALLRAPESKNGAVGPFHQGDAAHTADRIDLPSAERLRDAGFIESPGPRLWVMPTCIRRFFLARGEARDPDLVEEVHKRLGDRPLDPNVPESAVEVHHHAVLGGDAARAVETGIFYGADLQALAIRLSQRGKFSQAAKLYATIIEQFDERSAYAWEYKAYNLARANPTNATLPVLHQIRQGYEKAHELDSKNPLYHGRLLGFRAKLGEDIRIEFERLLKEYVVKLGENNLSWFARPVLKGLRNGPNWKLAETIVERWGPEIEYIEQESLDFEIEQILPATVDS